MTANISEKEKSKIKKVVKLSLIPNCNKRFMLVDGPKEISIELRCLPAIELYILISDSYPSSMGLLFLMSTDSGTTFYEPFKNFLYQKLNEKWVEDMIVLYECIYFV